MVVAHYPAGSPDVRTTSDCCWSNLMGRELALRLWSAGLRELNDAMEGSGARLSRFGSPPTPRGRAARHLKPSNGLAWTTQKPLVGSD